MVSDGSRVGGRGDLEISSPALALHSCPDYNSSQLLRSKDKMGVSELPGLFSCLYQPRGQFCPGATVRKLTWV